MYDFFLLLSARAQLHHIVAPHAVTASLFISDDERNTSSIIFATGADGDCCLALLRTRK
jgi:hypothetical protein